MKILAVETSLKTASVALTNENKLIDRMSINNSITHSEKIMPLIDNILNKMDQDINDIDYFAVGIGPGSFTGIRIGLTTIKAIAYASKRRVVGINTLDGLANSVRHKGVYICPIIDARNNQVYFAIYKSIKDGENVILKRISEYQGENIEKVLESLKAYKGRIAITGDGIFKHSKMIYNQLGDNVFIQSDDLAYPDAFSIAELAYKEIIAGNTKSPEELLPYYLRESQAEREYKKRKKERQK